MRKILLTFFMCCTFVCSTFAQNIIVSGIVTDFSLGGPLPGVVILQKDGSGSAMTDDNGFYTISVPKGSTIEFSLLGMAPKEYKVTETMTLNVALEEEARELDEVMVVAYGTTKKESFTGSAEVVKSDKLRDRSESNLTKMLDGQVAGVMTTSGSGQPGSGSGIRIRGFGSVNASSSPLIVVDGVPYDGDLSTISPEDIESISILKDASAGALYGARGANGVLIVNTKKGKAGEESVNIRFSAKTGVASRAIPPYETVDSREFLEHMYNAFYNDLVYKEGNLPAVAKQKTASTLAGGILGTNAIYNPFNVPVEDLFDEQGRIVEGASLKWDENWLEAAERKFPVRQEYGFSMNGSTGKAKYTASLSYLDENGTLETTNFRRYTARAGADFTPKDWLKYGLNLSYANTTSNYLGSAGTTNTNVWYSAMMMAPIYPVYLRNADGSFVKKDGEKVFDYGLSRPAGAQNNKNSVATLYDDRYNTLAGSTGLRGYLGAEWKGFSFTTNIGLDDVNTYETVSFNRHNGNAAGTGRLSKSNFRMLSYTWNQLLGYKKDFGEHNIDLTTGHEFYRYNLRYLMGEKTGFAFDGYDELAMGSVIAGSHSAADNYAIDSWLARVNYDFADKYYFSVSGRTDGSSRFRKDKRWGVFWSVGASWRISEEAFLKDVKWINNMTLKASYGVQGNDDLGTYYAWQALYDMNMPNADRNGAVIESIENADVTWEKNNNLNLGVEFRLFNKLSGTVEWYDRMTDDMLLVYPLPISLGFSGYNSNIGSIDNNGFDITLRGDIVNTNDFHWDATLIASTVNNKVRKLTGGMNDDIVSGVYIIREGEEINTFYMAKSAGVDPATGEQLYWAYEKNEDGSIKAGSEYITNSTTAASASKYLLGSRIPDIYGSIASSIRWKGWDAGFLMTWSLGGKIYDSVYYSLMEPSFVGQTYHKNALRSWQSAGEISDVPRATASSTGIINDRFLIDASYLALKSLTLGYSFQKGLISKAGLSSARVFLSADSPFILTHLKGMNPQASFSGSTSYSYTPNRSITLGVDIQF